jgi:starch-binding outer membrane protein, SusD/RagB family
MTATIKYIVTALVVVTTISSSCKKGWLDATSGAQVRSEELFKTEAGCKDALMGVYIGMTSPDLYAKEMTWSIVDVLSLQYNLLPDNANLYAVQSYVYKNSKVVAKVDALWNKQYNVIANVNSALIGIDNNKTVLPSITYSIMKGELLGLRAFLHFDLLRLYGHGNMANRPELATKLTIPYVTEFTKELTPQRTYTETFNLLKKDIDHALELLKEDSLYKVAGRPANYYATVNRDGFFNKREQRMNYYAVKALQARVLLWMGGAENVSNARLAAEDVIGNGPAKLINPATSPVTDRLLYAEHVFNLNVTKMEAIVNPPFIFNLTGDATNAFYLNRGNGETLYETGNSNIGLVDKRYHTLLEAQTIGLVPMRIFQKSTGIRDIMPLVTLPEMYYIAAEYYITNDLPKAIDLLNTVRSSRGIKQAIPSSATAIVVADELFREYRKEFVTQGQLFFYYKRLGRTAFPGFPATKQADDKIYVVPYPDNEVEFGNRVQ